MIFDFIVAVTLAETDIAFTVADRWIDIGKELTMSAGWSCCEWLLGTRKDSEFDMNKLLKRLNKNTRHPAASIHSVGCLVI